MNILRNITELNHWIASNYLNAEAICIDATCGNGQDTLFLAENSSKVFAFDIQKEAIENTRRLLEENGLHNVELICDGHEKMDEYVKQEVDVIMFNFGYLPKGNKEITTLARTSLMALEKSLQLIRKNGLICMILYYGHEEGKDERKVLIDAVSTLDYKQYQVGRIQMINQYNNPPEIVMITRKI